MAAKNLWYWICCWYNPHFGEMDTEGFKVRFEECGKMSHYTWRTEEQALESATHHADKTGHHGQVQVRCDSLPEHPGTMV